MPTNPSIAEIKYGTHSSLEFQRVLFGNTQKVWIWCDKRQVSKKNIDIKN